MGVVETAESKGLMASGGVPANRKPLSPAFRMAALTGALESVRLHLRSENDVDATDEKGRSPLMLAASRGHLDVCRLLLESGADPGLKDSEGNDALVIAIMRGQAAAAALLSVHPTRSNPGSDRSCDQAAVSHADEVEADSPAISIDGKEGVTGEAGGSAWQHAETSDEATEDVLTCLPMSDDDSPFDLSVWQEEITSPAPADDPECANAASGVQAILSRHTPIDTDSNWDDVEIELPELDHLARRHAQLTPDTRQALHELIIEALRDGRVRADRIDAALATGNESADREQAEVEADVRLALGDLGTVIDDEDLAPDVVIDASDDDEEQFGDGATAAVNFIGRLWANDDDPFALYARTLPTARLTREDETALGMTIEEGRLEVLAGIAASSAAEAPVRTQKPF